MSVPVMANTLARALRAPLRQAEIDHAAFARPLVPCQLHRCRATCCHDGVVLDPVELSLLEKAATRYGERLAQFEVDLSQALFLRDESGACRTATATAAEGECADDFPAHFPRTRCVFLDSQHRCAWQRLAEHLGAHPWAYKPFSCWMHPVALKPPKDEHARPILTVAGDPGNPLDFAACTPCGRPTKAGQPARDVLCKEIALLGEIAGRQFLAEMRVESANKSSDR